MAGIKSVDAKAAEEEERKSKAKRVQRKGRKGTQRENWNLRATSDQPSFSQHSARSTCRSILALFGH
jgi:hypothetical protein